MTIIIAEAGVNHNGDIELAKKLVDVAAKAGADYVKFQTFSADNLVVKGAQKAAYQKQSTDDEDDQFAMIQKLELSMDDHETLIAHCAQRGIKFLSTAFDSENLQLLLDLNCLDLVKIPSGEITNLPLMRHMAKADLPILMSTGMADMADIEAALGVLSQAGCARENVTVLHCTTAYPAPKNEINLRAMNAIGEHFNVAVGYSDHSTGIEVAIAAVALGAQVIEKHFTLDKTMLGPDHAASLEPDELAAMISAIRSIEHALGGDEKKAGASELANINVARKSIVARRAISAGEAFDEGCLTVKRPGGGLSPMLWDEVVGQTAKRDFAVDEMIDL